jgi:hypothetical protein
MVGKVALVAVVGHEDGAHKTRATYWNGEAMQSRDVNARRGARAVAKTTAAAARHAAQLAGVLRVSNIRPTP